MDPPDATNRIILPRPASLQTEYQSATTRRLEGPLPSSTIAVQRKSRQPKSATITDEEWELQKPNFLHLYKDQDLPLQEVMLKMTEEHHFKASKKQYNTKIAQWRIGKNVKENEMKAIVRKERERKKENPSKNSVFRVRKYPVDPRKIERFIRDKGIGEEDVIMLDAGTPSDISCDTPQSLHMTPEEHAPQLLGPVQSMTPSNSYIFDLSPRLRELPNSPHLDRLSPDFAFPTNSLNLHQLQHSPCIPSGSVVLTRPNTVHQWPSNNPRHSHHRSLHWRASISPTIVYTELSHSPLSSPPRDRALNRPFDPLAQDIHYIDQPNLFGFDWFKEYVNYSKPPSEILSGSLVGDLVRSFIREVDTYEAHKEQERLRSQWFLIKQEFDVDIQHDCEFCVAYVALIKFEMYFHYARYHPENLRYNIETKYPATEILRELLPALDSSDSAMLDIVTRAAWLLTQVERYQEVERVIKATTLEMQRQPEWNVLSKAITSLILADIHISCGRHDDAKIMVRDVLGGEFPVVATIADTAHVKFTTANILNGSVPSFVAGFDMGIIDDYKLTKEGLEIIRQYMGEDRVAEDIVYVHAILVLQRLNKHHVTEITDE